MSHLYLAVRNSVNRLSRGSRYDDDQIVERVSASAASSSMHRVPGVRPALCGAYLFSYEQSKDNVLRDEFVFLMDL
jgi:hypothetical protein